VGPGLNMLSLCLGWKHDVVAVSEILDNHHDI